jgi:hypothetical protein
LQCARSDKRHAAGQYYIAGLNTFPGRAINAVIRPAAWGPAISQAMGIRYKYFTKKGLHCIYKRQANIFYFIYRIKVADKKLAKPIRSIRLVLPSQGFSNIYPGKKPVRFWYHNRFAGFT